MGSKFDFRMSRSDYDNLCFDLTDDEHAVLDLRRRGMHNADIAAELYCSERTVNRRARALIFSPRLKQGDSCINHHCTATEVVASYTMSDRRYFPCVPRYGMY